MKAMHKFILYGTFISATLSSNLLQAQQQQLHLAGDNDATLLDGSGMLQIGETTAPNLVIDGNEILARNNGENSTLFLNIEGGDIRTGKDADPSNLWVTGFLRSGISNTYNPRFKFHHEAGVKSGSSNFINLNLPAGTTSQEVIMIQLRTVGGLGNMVPIDIATYDSDIIATNQIIDDGTNYHVAIIYIDN